MEGFDLNGGRMKASLPSTVLIKDIFFMNYLSTIFRFQICQGNVILELKIQDVAQE